MSPFPRLRIGRRTLKPEGAFAEAQAAFLHPDPELTRQLDQLCQSRNIGIVAHFYMDAELQGVLAALRWPHVFVADSLQMADVAVRMAQAGVAAVLVLGVDFMSENVRAVLDDAGFAHLPVYRADARPIGCSLAESADTPAYDAFLDRAARVPRALHLVYINTGLHTKARAHRRVPTLTCTSSNVVASLLQADAQLPEVQVFYGPDSYMGANLATMLEAYAQLPEDAVRALHPAHSPASLTRLRERFHPFTQGICVVHHLFGEEVVAQARRDHPDALITAHLEVPGEMFGLALAAQREGRGVVGSTSNLLQFLLQQVEQAAPGPQRLVALLGTESGMVTSIVRGVQGALERAGRDDLELELVFPVAAEAVAQAPESGLGILPGVAGGEGCSTAGGCATCPFMKQNTLDGVLDLLEDLGTERAAKRAAHFPRVFSERLDGRTLADLGGEPIRFMRHFQKTGQLPPALVAQVLDRSVPS
jgi:quinolinate synthase